MGILVYFAMIARPIITFLVIGAIATPIIKVGIKIIEEINSSIYNKKNKDD